VNLTFGFLLDSPLVIHLLSGIFGQTILIEKFGLM